MPWNDAPNGEDWNNLLLPCATNETSCLASSLFLFTWQTSYVLLLDPVLNFRKEMLKYREEREEGREAREMLIICFLMFARHCFNCSITFSTTPSREQEEPDK